MFSVSVNEHDPFFRLDDNGENNCDKNNNTNQSQPNSHRTTTIQTLHNTPAQHYCL